MYDEAVVLRMLAKAMIQALNASTRSGQTLTVTFQVDGGTQDVNAIVQQSDSFANTYGMPTRLDDSML